MRIAADQFVNGARPTGTLEQRPCVEIRTAGGQVWAQIALDAGEEVPTEAQVVLEEGAQPVTVALAANPSGLWATVPLAADAQISARPGYPRMVL